MTLKRVIDNLDGLDEAHKPFYIERNGKWFLDAEDEPETAALRRAKDREAEAARKLRERVAELELTVADKDEEIKNAKPGRKVDELENSWRQKLADAERKHGETIEKQKKYIEETLIEAEAAKLASMFTVPKVGGRLVKERLSVEFGEDGPKVRVLDAAGSPSAMSLEDLRKEFVDNKEYAPLIVATRGSGGGAAGSGGGSGSGAGKTFKEMDAIERTELHRTNPTRFAAEVAALKENK